MHYQPLVRLEDGVIVGCEALVRWQHPVRGLLAPAQFVGLAEDNGLIVQLGAWVLDEACRQAAAWRREGIDLAVSVNVSPRQLSRSGFVNVVQDTLSKRGLHAPSLCLEITETAVIGRVEPLAPILAQLRQLGVRIAMDDFGSGFSSLSHLSALPIDVIKIDGSFIRQVARPGADRAIVAAILSLGAEMGLAAIFPTCAAMHGIFAFYALSGVYTSDVHHLVVDWLSVPAGMYFLYVVRSLYRGNASDWNRMRAPALGAATTSTAGGRAGFPVTR